MVEPETVADGNGLTTTVAVPLAALIQDVILDSFTLVNVYTKVPAEFVGALTETELPLVVVIV